MFANQCNKRWILSHYNPGVGGGICSILHNSLRLENILESPVAFEQSVDVNNNLSKTSKMRWFFPPRLVFVPVALDHSMVPGPYHRNSLVENDDTTQKKYLFNQIQLKIQISFTSSAWLMQFLKKACVYQRGGQIPRPQCGWPKSQIQIQFRLAKSTTTSTTAQLAKSIFTPGMQSTWENIQMW